MVRRPGSWKEPLYVVLGACLLAASWFAGLTVEHVVVAGIRTTAAERASLYKSTLNNAINRLQHLPLVIAQHPAISAVLESGDNLDRVRAYLSSINTASHAAVIYVIDTSGRTIASSNWREDKSFEGRNYGFRPYFLDALGGREGRLFAIGVTTSRAGYFISRPVFSAKGGVLGVVVVKVELEQLRLEWGEGGENVLVTDPDGVVIMSSNSEWIYRTIAPLASETRTRIDADRTFIGEDLAPLNLISDTGGLDGAVTMDDVLYHASPAAPDANGLAVSYLAELGAANNARWLTSLLVLATGILSFVLFLYLRERRRKKVLHKEALEARRIRAVNEQLEDEIAIRRQTEEELRNTQEELVIAGKMAALGKMSAAIAHEVNQPVAAIRTFAASCKLLLERGKTGDVGETLDDITEMTERVASITGDLKLVARNSNDPQSRISLQQSIANSLKLFQGDLAEKAIVLEHAMPDEPVWVAGSPTRMEQVLINIIGNAIDAMAGRPNPRTLVLSVHGDGARAVITVSDTGCGLPPDAIRHLFEPFFTTKPVGQGTGLGLAISYGIVEEMGGKVRARNLEDGGAVFTITLPRIEHVLEDTDLEVAE